MKSSSQHCSHISCSDPLLQNVSAILGAHLEHGTPAVGALLSKPQHFPPPSFAGPLTQIWKFSQRGTLCHLSVCPGVLWLTAGSPRPNWCCLQPWAAAGLYICKKEAGLAPRYSRGTTAKEETPKEAFCCCPSAVPGSQPSLFLATFRGPFINERRKKKKMQK